MAPKKVVQTVKKSKKIAYSSSLNANMPKSETEGRKFEKISDILDLPPLEDLQQADNAATQLLKVGAEFRTLSAGYKARLRVLVVSVYAIALLLKNDDAAWIRFVRHEDWEKKKGRPQEGYQSDALRYAYRFSVGLTGKADAKKANKYYRALITCFNNDIPAEEALIKIEQAGGFDALAREYAEHRTKTKKPAKPVAAVNVGPAVARGTKKEQSAAYWDNVRSDLADATGKGLPINIVVENNMETARLLTVHPSVRLKMTFNVEKVTEGTVRILNARVKLGKKKQESPK